MSTKLERLLESIDPERVSNETARRADNSINSFYVDEGLITEWVKFQALMARFLCHVENAVLRLNPQRSVDFYIDWGRSCQLLVKEYGPNGEKAAFEISRTGNEGGLYSVLRAVARRLAEHYTQNETSAKISHYWNSLSADEMFDATTEYLEKYGHLLPSELTEGRAVRVRANFMKVLEQHPRLINEFRKICRY